jgi:hypothetical protein
MRDISNSTLIPNEILRPGILQMLIQHAIEPSSLILIPINAILDMLRRITGEMVSLALHRSHTGIHEEEPVGQFYVLAGAGWVGDFVVFVISFLQSALRALSIRRERLVDRFTGQQDTA